VASPAGRADERGESGAERIRGMARTKASGTKSGSGRRAKKRKAAPRKPRKRATKASATPAGSDDDLAEEEDEELPKDEAGRLKIKRQYEELLGIRIEKLKGRVLNRERINKTIEGIYFICASCKKICHNLDEGLVEDPENQNNRCNACGNAKDPRGSRSRKKKATAA
jgi:hypothetical protein